IKLSVDLDSPETVLPIDADRIEQMLVNLLENACKFTPRFGTITVRGYKSSMAAGDAAEWVRESDPSYRIDVKDNGAGIAPEHIDSILEELTSYAGGHVRSG